MIDDSRCRYWGILVTPSPKWDGHQPLILHTKFQLEIYCTSWDIVRWKSSLETTACTKENTDVERLATCCTLHSSTQSDSTWLIIFAATSLLLSCMLLLGICVCLCVCSTAYRLGMPQSCLSSRHAELQGALVSTVKVMRCIQCALVKHCISQHMKIMRRVKMHRSWLTGIGSIHEAVTIEGLTMASGRSAPSVSSSTSASCFVYVYVFGFWPISFVVILPTMSSSIHLHSRRYGDNDMTKICSYKPDEMQFQCRNVNYYDFSSNKPFLTVSPKFNFWEMSQQHSLQSECPSCHSPKYWMASKCRLPILIQITTLYHYEQFYKRCSLLNVR